MLVDNKKNMLINNKLIEQITNFIHEELKKPNSSWNTIRDEVKNKFILNTNNKILNDIMILKIQKIIDVFFKHIKHEESKDEIVCKPEDEIVRKSESEDEISIKQSYQNQFMIKATEIVDNQYTIKFFVPGIPKEELILNQSNQHLTLHHLGDNSDYLLRALVPIGAIVENSVYANGVLTVTIQLPIEKNIPIL